MPTRFLFFRSGAILVSSFKDYINNPRVEHRIFNHFQEEKRAVACRGGLESADLQAEKRDKKAALAMVDLIASQSTTTSASSSPHPAGPARILWFLGWPWDDFL